MHRMPVESTNRGSDIERAVEMSILLHQGAFSRPGFDLERLNPSNQPYHPIGAAGSSHRGLTFGNQKILVSTWG